MRLVKFTHYFNFASHVCLQVPIINNSTIKLGLDSFCHTANQYEKATIYRHRQYYTEPSHHLLQCFCRTRYFLVQMPFSDLLALLLTIYLNNRVFLSRNYRLIVTSRKLDVLKTNTCPRSEVLGGSPIGFFNPAVPTGIFPQSRNPEGFYRLIPIPVIFSKVLTSTETILLGLVSCISLH